jgi:hypothetical protein
VIGQADCDLSEAARQCWAVPGPITDSRAYELRKRYHACFGGGDVPVPVESIAEDLLGLAVREAEMDCSGVLVPARREIWLNAADRLRDRRTRFTLAHELGHWICHCLGGRPEPIYCRPGDLELEVDLRLEREANVFAAELLMPEPAVREAFAADGEVRHLAARFAVSPEAMQWRLYNFGLVDERPSMR